MVRTRVQLVQGDGRDVSPVHGQGVAGVAGEVRQRICSRHRAHVRLGLVLLTAVILAQVDSKHSEGENGRERERERAGQRLSEDVLRSETRLC